MSKWVAEGLIAVASATNGCEYCVNRITFGLGVEFTLEEVAGIKYKRGERYV